MDLIFATKFPDRSRRAGEPTHFVERVVKHQMETGIVSAKLFPPDFDYKFAADCTPKLHSIRRDQRSRWEKSETIDPVILVDGIHDLKRPSVFASPMWCCGTQTVEIIHGTYPRVIIDGNHVLDETKLERLITNEGFDSVRDFFEWFPDGYVGKIIHWTELRY